MNGTICVGLGQTGLEPEPGVTEAGSKRQPAAVLPQWIKGLYIVPAETKKKIRAVALRAVALLMCSAWENCLLC